MGARYGGEKLLKEFLRTGNMKDRVGAPGLIGSGPRAPGNTYAFLFVLLFALRTVVGSPGSRVGPRGRM